MAPVFCWPRKGGVQDCMHMKPQEDVSLTTRFEMGERRRCEVVVVWCSGELWDGVGSMDGGRDE